VLHWSALARPRKPELANLFRRVDEFRQEQRARKLEDTVERSRRVPRPADAGRENPGDEERKEW
jgi:hypothetical protein